MRKGVVYMTFLILVTYWVYLDTMVSEFRLVSSICNFNFS